MSAIPKEVLIEMITRDNLQTSGDYHSYLKDMFKDILQEMLVASVETILSLHSASSITALLAYLIDMNPIGIDDNKINTEKQTINFVLIHLV